MVVRVLGLDRDTVLKEGTRGLGGLGGHGTYMKLLLFLNVDYVVEFGNNSLRAEESEKLRSTIPSAAPGCCWQWRGFADAAQVHSCSSAGQTNSPPQP